jgi:hypothetical protein
MILSETMSGSDTHVNMLQGPGLARTQNAKGAEQGMPIVVDRN